MQGTAAIRASARIDRERHVLARQMLREGCAPGFVVTVASSRSLRLPRLGTRNICVELLEPELQLIGIEPLRAPPELAALEAAG